MSRHSDIGVIILAAGASTRLGSPKQLLAYRNKNLLQHTIDVISASSVDHITLVLGAHADLILPHISTGRCRMVRNQNWAEGMSSSIRYGLASAISQNPSLDAAIFVLCDQPYLTSEIIDTIVLRYQENPKRIINCNYGDGYGPPTLFSSALFPLLLKLHGSEGAKSIVKQYAKEVDFIDFVGGATDIDTLDDYESLSNKN
jgi:molybdenum cofactor cytidylyltransferase